MFSKLLVSYILLATGATPCVAISLTLWCWPKGLRLIQSRLAIIGVPPALLFLIGLAGTLYYGP
jgi:hypothetical protein